MSNRDVVISREDFEKIESLVSSAFADSCDDEAVWLSMEAIGDMARRIRKQIDAREKHVNEVREIMAAIAKMGPLPCDFR